MEMVPRERDAAKRGDVRAELARRLNIVIPDDDPLWAIIIMNETWLTSTFQEFVDAAAKGYDEGAASARSEGEQIVLNVSRRVVTSMGEVARAEHAKHLDRIRASQAEHERRVGELLGQIRTTAETARLWGLVGAACSGAAALAVCVLVVFATV